MASGLNFLRSCETLTILSSHRNNRWVVLVQNMVSTCTSLESCIFVHATPQDHHDDIAASENSVTRAFFFSCNTEDLADLYLLTLFTAYIGRYSPLLHLLWELRKTASRQ